MVTVMTDVATDPLAGFEWPSPEVIECPYAFYKALRDEAPIYRLPNGQYVVSRYADVLKVVRDTETFSSMIGPVNEHILGGPRVGGDASGPWPLPFTDAEDHHRQKSYCANLVGRERLNWFAPKIRRLVDELIDDFAHAGRVEFREAFALKLPRRVMMEMYGFTRDDEPDLIRWTAGSGPSGAALASPAEQAAEQKRRLELAEYLRGKILERLAEPTDDFLTEIVQVQVDRDGEPDMPYLLTEVANIFAGGNHTTAHMLSSTMLLLCENPDQLESVRENRTLIRPMLEESIRVESPVQWLHRITTRDTEFNGVEIPARSLVILFWASANRDERKFEDADRFWVQRPAVAKYQMGLGYGVHMCLGGPLARLEGDIAFNRLFDRLPNLRLAAGWDDVRHIPHPNQRAPEQVFIEFDPA